MLPTAVAQDAPLRQTFLVPPPQSINSPLVNFFPHQPKNTQFHFYQVSNPGLNHPFVGFMTKILPHSTTTAYFPALLLINNVLSRMLTNTITTKKTLTFQQNSSKQPVVVKSGNSYILSYPPRQQKEDAQTPGRISMQTRQQGKIPLSGASA
jgi:hypothetical protein